MANENTSQRLDFVEEDIGTMQNEFSTLKEMLKISRRLEQLINIQEDSTQITATSTTDKTKETVMVKPMARTMPEIHGISSSIGQHHDFLFQKSEMPVINGENPDDWILRAEREILHHQPVHKQRKD